MAMTGPAGTLRQIPPGIWMLGFVSLLMDVSSEMIHSLLPVFMVTSLGASALAVGLIEGVAEATALIVKIFSGALSDYLGKRKGLAVFGYGLGALSKPFFALAPSVGTVLGARSPTALARVFAVHHAMHSSLTLLRSICAALRLDCGSPWTRSVLSLVL